MTMIAKTYSERSNAIRAARSALGKEAQPGVDFETGKVPGGWSWAILPSHVTEVAIAAPAAPAAADDLEIPACLKISAEERAEGWKKNPPKAAPKMVSKPKKQPKQVENKTDLVLQMLKGKGASIEALTKATGWQAHTLRARICVLRKPQGHGGIGLMVIREKVDGATVYRAA